MKTLVLSHMFPRTIDDWGGIFVYEQVKALHKLEVDVRVVAGNPYWVSWRSPASAVYKLSRFFLDRRFPEWVDLNGVQTLFFPFLAPPWGYWDRTYQSRLRRYAEQIHDSFPFDLVHAHSAFPDGTGGAWLADQYKVPMVLTEHTGPFSTLTKNRAMRRQTERAINHAGAVIAVSERLKQDMISQVHVQDPTKISVVGNGIDPQIFYPPNDESTDNDIVRVLWVGGYQPVKQPFMLVDAFAAAHREDSRLRLSMVGYGPLKEPVRVHVKSLGLDRHVMFYPSGTRYAVADHMRRHHFLVISSESETFGLVAIESLACGRPVLATRCGGPEETVRDSSRGELVENTVVGLCQGFLRMTARMGEFDPKALHNYALENYSYDVIAARVKSTYLTELCKKRDNAYQRSLATSSGATRA